MMILLDLLCSWLLSTTQLPCATHTIDFPNGCGVDAVAELLARSAAATPATPQDPSQRPIR